MMSGWRELLDSGRLDILNVAGEHRRPLVFWGLLALLVLPVVFFRLTGSDLWFHLQWGRVFWETWGPPVLSQYFFLPVVEHVEAFRTIFLGEVLLYLTHALGSDVGLQLLRVSFAFLTLFLLYDSGERRPSAPVLFLLALACFGAYQKWLVRTALFELPLTVLVLWMFLQIRFKGRTWMLWLYPVVLGVWSMLHGSYLLGFVLLVLLLGGDLCDSLRGMNKGRARLVVPYLLVVVMSFACIGVKNHLTYMTFVRPVVKNVVRPVKDLLSKAGTAPAYAAGQEAVKHRGKVYSGDERGQGKAKGMEQAVEADHALTLGLHFYEPAKALDKRSDLWSRVKRGLNNTIFTTSGETIRSVDFLSPLDHVRSYTTVSLVLGGIGVLVLLIGGRRRRLSLVLPFLGVLVAGLGYFRIAGSVGIVTIWMLLSMDGLGDLRLPAIRLRRICAVTTGALCLACVAILCWNAARDTMGTNLGLDMHRFGPGRAESQETEVLRSLPNRYPHFNILTFISNGGKALYEWNGSVKVGYSAFFLAYPPQVLADYMAVLQNGNPDLFYERYAADVAVISLNRSDLYALFNNSAHWHPEIVALDTIVYRYHEHLGDVVLPDVLYSVGDIAGLRLQGERRNAAAAFYNIFRTLMKKGRLKDAFEYGDLHRDMQEGLKPYLHEKDRASVASVQREMIAFRERFGLHNTPLARTVFLYTDALGKRDLTLVRRYAAQLLADDPADVVVLRDVAGLALSQGETEYAAEQVDRLRRLDIQPAFRGDVAKIALTLADVFARDRQFRRAYELASYAHALMPGLLSDAALLQRGRDYYDTLRKESMTHRQGYALLKALLRDFPENGWLHNDLAYHMVRYASQGESRYSLTEAEGHVRQALALVGVSGVGVGGIYDTLARVLLRKRSSCEAWKAAQQALDFSTEEERSRREADYAHLFPQSPCAKQ